MKSKTTQKMWLTIGVIALIFGIITLIFSVQAAHRLVEEVYTEVMGREPTSARWHISVGIILVIGGVIAIITPWIKARKKRR